MTRMYFYRCWWRVGIIACGFTVLTLKRSILTEKVARRGYHLRDVYSVDPLEIVYVREVMRTNIAGLVAEDRGWVRCRSCMLELVIFTQAQRLLPVVDENGSSEGRGDARVNCNEALASRTEMRALPLREIARDGRRRKYGAE